MYFNYLGEGYLVLITVIIALLGLAWGAVVAARTTEVMRLVSIVTVYPKDHSALYARWRVVGYTHDGDGFRYEVYLAIDEPFTTHSRVIDLLKRRLWLENNSVALEIYDLALGDFRIYRDTTGSAHHANLRDRWLGFAAAKELGYSN